MHNIIERLAVMQNKTINNCVFSDGIYIKERNTLYGRLSYVQYMHISV